MNTDLSSKNEIIMAEINCAIEATYNASKALAKLKSKFHEFMEEEDQYFPKEHLKEYLGRIDRSGDINSTITELHGIKTNIYNNINAASSSRNEETISRDEESSPEPPAHFEVRLDEVRIQIAKHLIGKVFTKCILLFKPKNDSALVTISTYDRVMIAEFLVDRLFKAKDDALNGNNYKFSFEKNDSCINFDLTFRKEKYAKIFSELCMLAKRKIMKNQTVDDNNNVPDSPTEIVSSFRANPVKVSYADEEKHVANMGQSEIVVRKSGENDLVEIRENSANPFVIKFNLQMCSKPKVMIDKNMVVFACNEYLLPSGIYNNRILLRCIFTNPKTTQRFVDTLTNAVQISIA